MTPDALRRLRHALKLTQAEFAARLGVARGTVSAWEQGRYTIPRWHAVRIEEMAQGLDLPPAPKPRLGRPRKER